MGYSGVSATEPPAAFARRQFEGVDLGDRRLDKRAQTICERMAARPDASIPRQCADPHQAKAAYRFFDHPAVTARTLCQPHHERALDAARRAKLVLHVQDTTELSFGADRPGLGPIGYGEASTGLLMHSTLAITPEGDGAVLGLSHLKIWARGPARRGEAQAARRRRQGRESLRWKESIEAVGAPPEGVRWLHVGDREADVWETFCAADAVGAGCVVRACGAASRRKCAPGHVDEAPPRAEAQELAALARALPAAGGCAVERRARPGSPARTLELSVSFAPLTLLRPRLCGADAPASLPLWVVRAWEQKPSGASPTEWVILTTEPVADLADALRVMGWYERRWTIEEYHKCLKSGCRVEASQLKDGRRLEPLAAMLAIVALRLIDLKKAARRRPQRPATEAVPPEFVRALSRLRNIPESALTCERFWRETAKCGGFLGRKSDGDPGWQTLWRGWRYLEVLVEGARLGLGDSSCG